MDSLVIVNTVPKKTRIDIFANNTASNVFFKIIIFFIGFLTTPIIVKYFGVENYGVWVFVHGIISYFTIFTSGIPGGVVKFISENKENSIEKNKVINIALLFYCTIGIIISGVLLFGGDFFISFFELTQKQRNVISLMLKIGAFFIFFSWPINVFQAYLTAMIKFTFINIISLLNIIVGFIILLTCLYLRIDLPLIYLFYSLSTLLINSIYIFYVKSTVKDLKLSFSNFDLKLGKSLFKFTIGLFILEIISALAMQTDNFIIAYFLPVANVAYYNITTKITYLFRGNIYGMLLLVVTPMIFEAQKKNDDLFIRKMIFKGTRYFIIILIPLVSLFIIIMKPFITLWMGPDFGRFGYWGSLYMAQFLFSPITAIMGSVMIGLSKLKPLQIMSFLMVIINLTVSVIFVQQLGFTGVIVGTVAAQYLVFPFIYYLYCKHSNVHWLEPIKNTWKIFCIIIILFLLPGFFIISFIPLKWIYLIIFSITYLFILYFILIFLFVEEEEKNKIKLFFNKYYKLFRK